MSVLFDGLEKILNKHKEISEQLMRTTKELKSAALIGDINMINIWMEKTQVHIKRQKVLNDEREQLVGRICNSFGCSHNATLRQLLKYVDRAQADRLTILMEDIKRIMAEQQRINQTIYKISRARLGVMENINQIIYRAAGLPSSMAAMNEAMYRKEV